MRVVYASITSFALAVVSLSACNALTGSGDLDPNGLVGEAIGVDGGEAAAKESSTPPSTPIDAATKDIYVPPAVGCPSAGRECVQDAPPGWDGPLIVYDGLTATVPGCPNNLPVPEIEWHRTPESGAHSCTACNCGNPTGVTCKVEMLGSATADCASPTSQTITSGCLNDVSGAAFRRLVVTATSPGQCNATGGSAQRPPITWKETVRGCGAPNLIANGCEAGKVCTPTPEAPFLAKHCVAKEGNVECPKDTPYINKLPQAFADTDDQRACSSCACGPVTSPCQATLRMYPAANGTCGGVGSTTFNLPTDSSACTAAPAGAYYRTITTNDNDGDCNPTGQSTPSGSVVASDPTTVCCD